MCIMFTKSFWWSFFLLLVPPAAALYLGNLPQAPMTHGSAHFWIVLLSAVIAGVVGCFTYKEYTKSKSFKVLLLAIGFVGTAIIYVVHSLITPGHSLITIEKPDYLANAFVLFGDASRLWLAVALILQSVLHRERVLRRPLFLIVAAACLVVIVSGVFLNNPSIIPRMKNDDLTDTNFSLVFKICTLVLLAVAASQCLEGWRILKKKPLLVVSAGVVLATETVVLFLIAKLWSPTWWLAHFTYLAAFLAVGYGLYLTDKNQRLEFVDASAQIEKYIKEIEEQSKRLERLATIDAMTGLLNRRAFLERLESDLAKAAEENTEFSMAFIDLDGLKLVNDTYGHREGDWFITAVASALHVAAHQEHTVGRLGGDEFAVFFPGYSQVAAESLLRQIGQQLELLAQSLGKSYKPSCSAGVVHVSAGQQITSEKLLLLADDAMYRQKRICCENKPAS